MARETEELQLDRRRWRRLSWHRRHILGAVWVVGRTIRLRLGISNCAWKMFRPEPYIPWSHSPLASRSAKLGPASGGLPRSAACYLSRGRRCSRSWIRQGQRIL